MNEETKLNKHHYRIFAMSWAGWVFDFYDLVLFTFLVSQLQSSLHFSAEMLSLCLGMSLFATGFGGIILDDFVQYICIGVVKNAGVNLSV